MSKKDIRLELYEHMVSVAPDNAAFNDIQKPYIIEYMQRYHDSFKVKANGAVKSTDPVLHIDSAIQCVLPDTPDDEIYDAASELYKAGKMLNATLLVKRHTTMNPSQAKQYCDAHFK